MLMVRRGARRFAPGSRENTQDFVGASLEHVLLPVWNVLAAVISTI